MNQELVKEIIVVLQENISNLKSINLEGDTPLISSGLVESIDFIDILSVLEGRYNIVLEVDTLDFGNFESANLITKMVSELVA